MTFTDKKPTAPGVYWFKQCESDEPTIALIQCFEGRACTNLSGLWSSRLVPVEEVERAYREGLSDSASVENPIKKTTGLWLISRARRVVEGKETT